MLCRTGRIIARLIGAVLLAACFASVGARAQDPRPGPRAKTNQPPKLTAHFAGNRTFLWPGVPLEYLVIASDPEDGDTLSGRIDPERVAVTFQYNEKPEAAAPPKPVSSDLLKLQASGRRLIAGSDCVLCHAVSGNHPIPTYAAIAEFYEGRTDAMATLAAKIMTGGSGVWGETGMPPHPHIFVADARAMARYILSLTKPEARRDWLPARGVIQAKHLNGNAAPKGPFGNHAPGRYLFSATYTDQGGRGGGKGAGRSAHVTVPFRAPLLLAAERTGGENLRDVDGKPGPRFAASTTRRAVLRYDKIDLTGVRSLNLFVGNDKNAWKAGRIEIRIGSAIGKVIGRATANPDGDPASVRAVAAPLTPVRGLRSLFIVLRGGAVALAAIGFER